MLQFKLTTNVSLRVARDVEVRAAIEEAAQYLPDGAISARPAFSEVLRAIILAGCKAIVASGKRAKRSPRRISIEWKDAIDVSGYEKSPGRK